MIWNIFNVFLMAKKIRYFIIFILIFCQICGWKRFPCSGCSYINSCLFCAETFLNFTRRVRREAQRKRAHCSLPDNSSLVTEPTWVTYNWLSSQRLGIWCSLLLSEGIHAHVTNTHIKKNKSFKENPLSLHRHVAMM